MKTENDENTWGNEEKHGICVVIDLIHPVHVFLSERWGFDIEKYRYDSYRYRFAYCDDFGHDCLDTVFKYLASPDWKAFVEEIDFSSVEFDQPWAKRIPNPDMSWI